MRSGLSAVFVAAALIVAGPGAIAAPSAKTNGAGASTSTDFSVDRHHKRYHRHAGHWRPYPPARYYARPVFYRPYPYRTPAPFIFGIGFGPAW